MKEGDDNASLNDLQ